MRYTFLCFDDYGVSATRLNLLRALYTFYSVGQSRLAWPGHTTTPFRNIYIYLYILQSHGRKEIIGRIYCRSSHNHMMHLSPPAALLCGLLSARSCSTCDGRGSHASYCVFEYYLYSTLNYKRWRRCKHRRILDIYIWRSIYKYSMNS